MMQLPKVVQNKASIAYNKGQTFINAQNPKALEACGEVFQEKFQKFLVHRATELAPGGLLVLLFRGRWTNLPTMEIVDEPPHHPCMDFGMEAWEASWEDLIFEVGENFFLFNDVQQILVLKRYYAKFINIIVEIYVHFFHEYEECQKTYENIN